MRMGNEHKHHEDEIHQDTGISFLEQDNLK